jgi:hypothetical protein
MCSLTVTWYINLPAVTVLCALAILSSKKNMTSVTKRMENYCNPNENKTCPCTQWKGITGGIEVEIHSFLTLALDVGEWQLHAP